MHMMTAGPVKLPPHGHMQHNLCRITVHTIMAFLSAQSLWSTNGSFVRLLEWLVYLCLHIV